MARRQCSSKDGVSGETVGTKYASSSSSASAALEEGYVLVEDAGVAGHPDVLRDGVGQPEQVVGDPGAHARARVRVPPVLDVALDELARRGGEDLLPR